MKKYVPFVFPAAAVLVVVFLTYRWYSHNTTGVGQISEFAEGIEIEELTTDEQSGVMRGVGDISTIDLTPEQPKSDQPTSSPAASPAPAVRGQVRYEIAAGKVRFSVNAALPELTDGTYQVWLKDVAADAFKKAFVLEMGKAGYMGSAAIDEETLPFEVVVSREVTQANAPSDVLLRGTIEKKADSQVK